MPWLTRAMWVVSLAAAAVVAAQPAPPSASTLDELLGRLAGRAELHRTLLYRMQCIENVTRVVSRSRQSSASFGLQPDQMIELRHGITVVRRDGSPQEDRVRLDKRGEVRLDGRGQPIAAALPAEFAAISRAFPQAQVVWFTAEDQERLSFSIVEETAGDTGLRPDCGEDRTAIEFLDRTAPQRSGPKGDPRCSARPSGVMCLDRRGEIAKILFYGLYPDEHGCVWDRTIAFATIEQEHVERTSGLRFPSRVRTVNPLDWRDTEIFVQTFESCVFSNVHVTVQP